MQGNAIVSKSCEMNTWQPFFIDDTWDVKNGKHLLVLKNQGHPRESIFWLSEWLNFFLIDLSSDYVSITNLLALLAAHFIIRINPSLSTMWFGGLIAQCSLIMSDINFFTATVVWHSFSPLLCFVDSSWQDIVWDSGSSQVLPFQIFRVSSFLHSDCWQDNEINLQ